MKSTFKTLFYLKKNEPKKNGHVVIMVRITVDGDQVQFINRKTSCNAFPNHFVSLLHQLT